MEWIVYQLVLNFMDESPTTKFRDTCNWIEANNDWRVVESN